MDTQIKTLFTPSAPISESTLFSGRSEQLNRINDAILERGKHVILFGERGVGKTSIANKVENDNTQDKICIYIFSSTNHTFNTMWKEIFEQITFQSSKQSTGFNAIIETVQRKFSDLIDWDKEVSDNIILNTISYLSIPVIIIIDEFDKLNDDVKMRISNIMKLFSDTGKNITMIIVGVADDIQKLIAGHESIKRNIAEIKMPRMSIEELAEILNSRLTTLNMTIDVNAKEKVVKLSQGLPEYIHAIGKGAAIYCNNRQNNCITKDDVMNSIKEFIKISDESSRLTYQKAVSSNQANTLFADVLLACAEVQCDDNGRFTQKSVVEPLSKIINRTMPIAGFQTHIAAFCTESRGNILERNGKERSFRYRFAEPRMQIYVLMNGILSNKVQW